MPSPTPSISVDTERAQHTPAWLVRVLYGEDDRPKGHVVVFRSREQEMFWIDLQDLSNLDQIIGRLAERDSVYLSVCAQDRALALEQRQRQVDAKRAKEGKPPRTATTKFTRGYTRTTSAVPGVWTDLDCKADGAHAKTDLPTREQALSFIEAFPVKPTLVIHSGYGFYLYWLFKRPLVLTTDEERAAAQKLLHRWQAFVNRRGAERGWTFDSTHDLARVLRPPGSVNHKLGEARPVTVLGYDPDARYSIPELQSYLPPEKLNGETEAAGPRDGWGVEEIREMLSCIRNQPHYDDWFRISAAVLHGVGGDVEMATVLLREWRPEEVEGEYRLKLESGLDGSITVGTLYYHAVQNGYAPPRERNVYKGSGHAMTAPPVSGDGYGGTGQPPAVSLPAKSGHNPDFRRTDMGNGYLFAYLHGRDLRYCFPYKHFLVWTGTHWRQDVTGEAERRAKATVEWMHAQALATKDPDEKKKLRVWAYDSETNARLSAMVTQARSELYIEPESLDTDTDLFNVLNGTIDTRSGQLLPHAREHYITKIANVAYDPTAKCPRWIRFVDEIFSKDEELVAYMQRVCGYWMTGSVVEQVLNILYGSGSNGKGTLIEVLLKIFGDYGQAATEDLLIVKRQGSGANEEQALLKGARFVTVSETKEGARMAVAVVKKLTGGDTIRARKNYGNFFEFTPTHKIALLTNHKPIIGDTDHAIWRRIHLIPFNQRFPIDGTLLDTLLAEKSGILNWLVEGVTEWRRHGLKPPPSVQSATAEYRSQMDIFAQFVTECLDLAVPPQVSTGATDLYREYCAWCARNGETAKPQRSFGLMMTDRGFQRTTSNGTFYTSVQIKSRRPPDEPF